MMKEMNNELRRKIPLQNDIVETCTDFCLSNNNNNNMIIELKMTGDVDKGKAKSIFINDMLDPYISFGDEKEKQIFFGIMSNSSKKNKKGEWATKLSHYFAPEIILTEEDLFKIILPENITYVQFISMISERIRSLLNA